MIADCTGNIIFNKDIFCTTDAFDHLWIEDLLYTLDNLTSKFMRIKITLHKCAWLRLYKAYGWTRQQFSIK